MNYGKIIIVVSLILVMLLFMACAPRQAPVLEPTGLIPASAKEAEKVTAKEAWETEWDRTLQAAQKEGKVVIYSASAGVLLKEAEPSFRKKYGITLEVLGGKGAELSAKFLQERANGLYLTDILMFGLNPTFGAVKLSGALAPLEPMLILPEVVDPKMWYEGKVPWLDKEHMVLTYVAYPTPQIAINSELVKPEEIKSYYDLLDPKWKGKIIINDPTIDGTAFNGFASLILNRVLDLDFFRQLVSQQTQIIRNERLQIDWLARGKYHAALWPRTVFVNEFQKSGAPVTQLLVKEGTYLGGSALTLVNKSPHPNAAKIFVNWVLTRETQTLMQDSMGKHSSRVDTPTEGLASSNVRMPGEKYFIGAGSVEEWVIKGQDRYLEIAKKIFGPLLR